MSLISDKLKEGVLKLLEKLMAPDYPSTPVAPTVAETKLIGPQTSEAVFADFTLRSDEPESMGGGGSAPPPSTVFVSAIGFAENVIFARQAAMLNVDFDSFETRVEAQWDRRGLFEIKNADPSISDLFIETRIVTKATPERVAELLTLTHRRCPMTRTMAKAAKIRRRLLVNGKETRVKF